MSNPYGGERSCPITGAADDTRFIVLTGGPGAGKTAILELFRKLACDRTAILPEAASVIYGGGFWRLPSVNARTAAQIAIFHAQVEMERLVRGEGRWLAGVCDRGSLDGLAYWPGEPEPYFKILNTTRQDQLSRYHAVIHLRCPHEGRGYDLSNPLRVESAAEAARIDERIETIWSAHPRYHQINKSDRFFEKADAAIELIKGYLPEICQRHFAGGFETKEKK